MVKRYNRIFTRIAFIADGIHPCGFINGTTITGGFVIIAILIDVGIYICNIICRQANRWATTVIKNERNHSISVIIKETQQCRLFLMAVNYLRQNTNVFFHLLFMHLRITKHQSVTQHLSGCQPAKRLRINPLRNCGLTDADIIK
ncbi:MAG: hypothetical protein K0Q78_2111 [Cellvibrio sp.]|nr:hypothetical protein [Cellvibrio sp.]